MKNIFKPKQFISSLPGNFYPLLFFVVIIMSLLVTAILIIPNYYEFLNIFRNIIIGVSGLPGNVIISSSVLGWTLIMGILFNFFVKVVQIIILIWLLKLIFKAFKLFCDFWKLINIYLYAKIWSLLVVAIYYCIILFDKGKTLKGLEGISYNLLNQGSNYLNYIMSNRTLMLLMILSAIVFYGIFIYGVKISVIKKK